jgi:ribosomal-protein-alanine N-acetyltransferase
MTAEPTPKSHRVSLLWAGPDRADAIAALHAKLFDPSWSSTSVADLLDHPASTSLVVLAGEPREVAGFVIAHLVADEAEILSLGVAPERQRRGLGRQLVEALVRAVRRSDVRRVFLEVAADNAAAAALYRRLGFAETGRRKSYYERKGGTTVDALTLALSIGDAGSETIPKRG